MFWQSWYWIHTFFHKKGIITTEWNIIMSEIKPIIPKKISDMTHYCTECSGKVITSAKPPAIIMIRITTRLKVDDQNDNLLLSFWYNWVFCLFIIADPFVFRKVRPHQRVKIIGYLSIIKPVTGIIQNQEENKVCIDLQSIKKEAGRPLK